MRVQNTKYRLLLFASLVALFGTISAFSETSPPSLPPTTPGVSPSSGPRPIPLPPEIFDRVESVKVDAQGILITGFDDRNIRTGSGEVPRKKPLRIPINTDSRISQSCSSFAQELAMHSRRSEKMPQLQVERVSISCPTGVLSRPPCFAVVSCALVVAESGTSEGMPSNPVSPFPGGLPQ